jgi:glutamate--cysteine ligase
MIAKGYEKLELSTQILITGALERGIEVDVLDWDENFIRLKKGDKVEYVKQATKTSADTYISQLIMENKEVTKIILRENSINVPSGISVKSVAEASEHYFDFEGKDIVIKPKSTNFGTGVVIIKNLLSDFDFETAVTEALKFDNTVLIEEFIPGKEYRFLVIDNVVAGIIHRVPANVVGDGTHTIEQLVIEKNKDPLRGKGYVTPLEKLTLGTGEETYLAAQGKNFSYIPNKNETVYLRENSNISTGGDSIDFTDEVHEQYKTIAINAAKAVGAKVCGADIIIRDVLEPPDATNYSIIELNFNPALHIHAFPYKGQRRHVENNVLNLLGFKE